MQGLDVTEATVDDDDRDVAVATLRADPRLVGPAEILQGGFAAASIELAARVAGEAMLGVAPGDPRVSAATMIEARLHKPSPVGAELTALVERIDDDSYFVRTVPADGDEEADFGDDSSVGADVLVSGEVELNGHGPEPTLDDLVELALVDQVPTPVALAMAPTCVVCGIDHPTGLRLFPAWLDGASVVQEWTPADDVAADQDGFVDPAAVAAVLDCPTVFACRDHMAANGFSAALLGGFTVAWFSRVPLGEKVRIAARMEHAEGRKMTATAALVGPDGHVHAAARAFQVGVTSFPGGSSTPMTPYEG